MSAAFPKTPQYVFKCCLLKGNVSVLITLGGERRVNPILPATTRHLLFPDVTQNTRRLNKILWAIVKGEKNYQRSGQTTMWSLSRFSTDRSAIWMARQGHEQINREHGCHFNRCSKAMLEMNSQRAASYCDANIKPSASTLWSVSLCVHPNMVSQQHQNTQYSSTNTKS